MQGPWPCFSWSHDDKYFARKGRDLIMVYESETCSLLRDAEGTKRSLKAPGVKDFKWSPCGYDTKKGGTMATGGEPVLAYWSPENEADSTPASVKLHLLPSRKVLRYISRSMVDHIQLIWHPLGEYLCVQVKRHKKSKKTYYTNFEIFRMKDVHKEVALNISNKMKMLSSFNGNRLGQDLHTYTAIVRSGVILICIQWVKLVKKASHQKWKRYIQWKTGKQIACFGLQWEISW